MINEMAIRRKVECEGKKYHGYVEANMLVFLIVSINSAWKVSVAYFLVNRVSGEQRTKENGHFWAIGGH